MIEQDVNDLHDKHANVNYSNKGFFLIIFIIINMIKLLNCIFSKYSNNDKSFHIHDIMC